LGGSLVSGTAAVPFLAFDDLHANAPVELDQLIVDCQHGTSASSADLHTSRPDLALECGLASKQVLLPKLQKSADI
jgi:hypothetical protein